MSPDVGSDPGSQALGAAKQAFTESAEQCRVIVASLREGIVMLDRDGHVLTQNDAARRLLGDVPAEALGLASGPHDWNLIGEDGEVLPASDRPGRRTLDTGEPTSDVLAGIRQDGGAVTWLLVNALPLPATEAAPTQAVLLAFSDVTGLKEAEIEWRRLNAALEEQLASRTQQLEATTRALTEAEAASGTLRESEERNRALVEHLRSGVAVYEATGDGDDFIIRDLNRAGARMEKTTKKAVLGRPVTKVFPGIRELGLLEVFQRVWRSGRAEHLPAALYRDEHLSGWRENWIYRLPSGQVVAIYNDVTERVHAEHALRESEARYRSLFEDSPFAMWEEDNSAVKAHLEELAASGVDNVIGHVLADPREYARCVSLTRVIDANKAAVRLFEARSRDELLARNSDLYRSESARGVHHFWSAMLAGDHQATFEESNFSLRGTEIHVLETCTVVPGHEATFDRVYVADVDITERKHAEDELRAKHTEVECHRELLAKLLDTIPSPVFYKDATGVYLGCNRAFEQLLGRERGEIVGKSVADMAPPEIAETYDAMDRRLFEQPGTQTYEWKVQAADGSQRDVVFNKATFNGDDGQVAGLIGVMLDVTERKQAEEMLQRSTQLLRDTGAMARVGGWELDLSTDEVTWNDEVCRIHGVEPGYEPRLDEALSFFAPESRPALEQAIKHAVRTGEPWDLDLLFIPAGSKERIWVRMLGRALYSGDRVARLTGTFQDIDTYRRAEDEIRRLNAELEERVITHTEQRDAAARELEAFAYSVAHDVRTPLRAIDGFATMVLADDGEHLSPASVEHLGRAHDAAQRMAHLLDDVLGLSRVSSRDMHREPVDLRRLALEVAEELRAEQPQRQVEFAVAPDLDADADPALTRLVLRELLANAWKFTAGRDVAHVEVGARDAHGERAFYVRDDGAGFDMRCAEHLFGAFQRMHRAEDFGGDGIGLATVQRIVRRHGGRVWAEAEVEQGATFYFTLPVATGKDSLPGL